MKNIELSKSMSLDQLKDKHIGEIGSSERMAYEQELKMELVGDLIRKIRKEKKMTQSELGVLVGVQKAQISKLENGAQNATISTIVKVFSALNAKMKFWVEIGEQEMVI